MVKKAGRRIQIHGGRLRQLLESGWKPISSSRWNRERRQRTDGGLPAA